MENDVLYNRIMNVVHEEYGEGSTAVANPEGEPTDDLTSIQIGDEIYGISGGGGGGTDRFFEVHCDDETLTLDKTWQQIFDAIEDGKLPFYVSVYSDPDDAFFWQCNSARLQDDTYFAHFYSITYFGEQPTINLLSFSTDSASGYPAVEDD